MAEFNGLYQSIKELGVGRIHSDLQMGRAPLRIVGEEGEYELVGGGDGTRYSVQGTGIVIDVAGSMDPAHGVITQQLTLRNEGTAESPVITGIEPLVVPLDVPPMDRPWARSLGGGLTHFYYPPPAYSERMISFGQRVPGFPDLSGPHPYFHGFSYSISSSSDGRSSNQDFPILQIGWQKDDEKVGLWAALEWSGIWDLRLGQPRGKNYFELSSAFGRLSLTLQPGESLKLPVAHLGLYTGSVHDGGNRIRNYIAEVISPRSDGERPVPVIGYDHWFGVGQKMNEEILMTQAARSAELGLELFIVDACWYGVSEGVNPESFAMNVGNWERVNQTRFPRGLKPLEEFVHSRGMKFGLWFEPERAHRVSDWATRHPDWYMDTGRQHLHLNLAKKEVQDGLIQLLSDWVERLNLDWIRWDYNHGPKSFWDETDPTGKIQFHYIDGLYRVFEEMTSRFPGLAIECCASGGRRIDLGTIRRTVTAVYSDHAIDPHVCRIMQTGAARFLPGNVPTASMMKAMTEGDQRFSRFSLLSRMSGGMLFNGDIDSWSEAFLEEAKRVVQVFKEYRHLLMDDFYPLTPMPRTSAEWDVVQFVDPDGAESVILAYRFEGDDSLRVHPRALQPDQRYAVRDPFGESPRIEGTGKSLMSEGLLLELPPDGAALRRVVAIS